MTTTLKTFLLAAVLLSLTMQSRAQWPNHEGLINVVTDIAGTEHDIPAYLDEGKPVFIFGFTVYSHDFFVYHELGAAQALYSTIGQGGSNEALVLYVAGLGYTDAASLSDTDFSESLGPDYASVSWLEGTDVPFVLADNNPPIAPHFMEWHGVHMICPEGNVYYGLWYENEDLEAGLNEKCCSVLKSHDPALGPAFQPWEGNCDVGEASFMLYNRAYEPLTSCDLEAAIGGVTVDTWTWTGNIPACSSEQLAYPNPDLVPGTSLTIHVVEDNEVLTNDTVHLTMETVTESWGHLKAEFAGAPGIDINLFSINPLTINGDHTYITSETNWKGQLFLPEGCHKLRITSYSNSQEIGGLSDTDFYLTAVSPDGLSTDTLLHYPTGTPLIFDDINLQITATSPQQVWGYVFEDAEGSQAFDPSLNGIPGIAVHYGPYQAVTDVDGYWTFPAHLPGEQVTISYDADLWPVYTTPSAGFVFAPTFNTNFGLNSDAPVTALDLSINHGQPYICDLGVMQTVTVKNIGNQPASGTLEIGYDPLLNLIESNNTPVATGPNSLSFELSTLMFGHQQHIHLHFEDPGAAALGSPISTDVTLEVFDAEGNFTGQISENHTDTLYCAYDPNDKVGFPRGTGPQGLIAPDTPLKYRIRFQNTGNLHATNVLIVDTLPENLNLQSFLMDATSHHCQVLMNTESREVRFFFPNIMLPDSASDPLGSIGHLFFDIDMMPGLSEGSTIANTAHIFFDTNPAIVTNTSLHTISTALSTAEHGDSRLMHIYPNPGSGEVRIVVPQSGSMWNIALYDMQGRRCASLTSAGASEHELRVDFGHLPGGVYILQAVAQSGEAVLYGKWVKE